MNITRTIPEWETQDWVYAWFKGNPREHLFPVRGEPRRAGTGDCLYIIFRGAIAGRFRIKRVEPIAKAVVGPDRHEIKGSHYIVVEASGQKARKVIPRKGHMGIRYDDVPEWPC